MNNPHSVKINNKEFYAFDQVIGIGPDGHTYTGHDGWFGEGEKVTQEDEIALAKLMIERWEKYLASLHG